MVKATGKQNFGRILGGMPSFPRPINRLTCRITPPSLSHDQRPGRKRTKPGYWRKTPNFELEESNHPSLGSFSEKSAVRQRISASPRRKPPFATGASRGLLKNIVLSKKSDDEVFDN